jgi:5,10-methenyltetrahydromethanopterin hydrogenase
MQYRGKCNEDSEMAKLFRDASDMACVIANSETLAWNKFLDMFGDIRTVTHVIGAIEVAYYHFGWNEERRIAWAYDDETDIHYFFA